MEALAHIYFSQGRREIVVASISVNDAGIYYEQEAGARAIALACGPEMLGDAVLQALVQFNHVDRNLRTLKKSDWPAFRASSAKSIRAFEAGVVVVGISRVGDSFWIRGAPNAQAFVAETSIPATSSPNLLGEAAFKLFLAVASGQQFAT